MGLPLKQDEPVKEEDKLENCDDCRISFKSQGTLERHQTSLNVEKMLQWEHMLGYGKLAFANCVDFQQTVKII